MSTTLCLLAIALTLFAAAGGGPTTQPEGFKPVQDGVGELDAELTAYRWKYRPVLLFGPAESPILTRQREALVAAAAELAEREMIVVEVVGDGGMVHVPTELEAASHRLSPDQAAALRKRFEVEPGTFAVLLIGKDGGEKRRVSEVIEPRDLFVQIDGMPMRRDEMRQRSPGAAEATLTVGRWGRCRTMAMWKTR